jgi:predicted RNase H-like HicB family nuclease
MAMQTLKNMSYTVKLEPTDEGGYFVSVPALPGCFTQGETVEEALAMASDVIQVWIESLVKEGESVPVEETVEGAAMSYRVNIPITV